MPKQLTQRHSTSRYLAFITLLVLSLTLLRFAIGLVKLPTLYFRDDEWVTMLAANMVAHKGLPILPSGLFYEHGLLFSYIDGLVFALSGFHELMARWPGVLINALAIPLAYRVGREIFHSPIAGLLVAAGLVFEPTALEWGWRARMYGLGHVMSWLLILSVWRAGIQPHQPRYRSLALGIALLSLMTHLALALIIAALGVAWLTVSLSDGRIRRVLAPQMNSIKSLADLGGALLVGGYALLTWKAGFASQHGNFEDSISVAIGKLSGAFLWAWIRGPDSLLYVLFLAPFVVGVLIWPISYRKLGWTRQNRALVFLYIALAFIIATFVLVFGRYWWRAHYLFMILLPLFILAGAGGLLSLGALIAHQIRPLQRRWVSVGAGLSLATLLVLLSWSAVKGMIQPPERLTYPAGHPYDQAFAYIDKHWQPDDQLMTVYTATCKLYSEHCDLYPNQTYPGVFERDGKLVDVYAGRLWLPSLDEVKSELEAPGTLWFVGDTGKSFDAASLEYGMAHMESVFHSAYVAVWRER